MEQNSHHDAHSAEPAIKNKVITISYSVHWYGAGAAHPNQYFSTFAFVLEPLILIKSLPQIFIDEDVAFKVLQKEIRTSLIANKNEEGEVVLDPEWVERGTTEWGDFSSFIFREDALEILFAPYAVGPYSDGPHFALVGYDKIAKLVRPEYVTALEIRRYTYD